MAEGRIKSLVQITLPFLDKRPYLARLSAEQASDESEPDAKAPKSG
jgi:hypothetical protein